MGGAFLGLNWDAWMVLGMTGNAVFFSRFIVQWWATEKHQRVVVPNAFWWLSLAGSLCLLAYGLHKGDSVFILAYAFTWIPYIRNLVISHRVVKSHLPCPACDTECLPSVKYCPECGGKIKLPADPGV